MRPIRFTFGNFAAASINNIAQSQTLAAAGFVNLNGTTGGVLDQAREIIITSAGNDSAVVFTVKGISWDGRVITEQFNGGNIGAATSVLDYATVTSIYASAGTTSIQVGTNTVATRVVPIDTYANPTNIQINAVVTGTITFQIDQTLDDIWNVNPTNWFALQASGSATVQKTDTVTATALRLKVTAFTAGAGNNVFFELVQAGGTTAA